MRKLLLTTLIATSSLMVIFTGCSSNAEQTSNIETAELEAKTENETEPTEVKYTEDEYKALCSEKYYDDFLKAHQEWANMLKYMCLLHKNINTVQEICKEY